MEKGTLKERLGKLEPKFEIGQKVYYLEDDKIKRDIIGNVEIAIYESEIYLHWHLAFSDATLTEEYIYSNRLDILKKLSVHEKAEDDKGDWLHEGNEVIMRDEDFDTWEVGIFVRKRTLFDEDCSDIYEVKNKTSGVVHTYTQCLHLRENTKDYIGTAISPFDVEW